MPDELVVCEQVMLLVMLLLSEQSKSANLLQNLLQCAAACRVLRLFLATAANANTAVAL